MNFPNKLFRSGEGWGERSAKVFLFYSSSPETENPFEYVVGNVLLTYIKLDYLHYFKSSIRPSDLDAPE